MSATRRRLPALAVLLAVVLLCWGAASGISFWEQVSATDYDLYEGTALTVLLLHQIAAFCGAWAVLWALFGLGWRPPLHLGSLLVLLAVVVDVAALVVVDRELGLSVGDQLEVYLDAALGEYDAQAFWTAVPLVSAPFVLVLWLVVLGTGAGQKFIVPAPAPYGGYPQPGYHPQAYPQAGYPQQVQQPGYQQQAFQQPACPQPAYQQPAQSPVAQQPAYQQPAYQPPAYQPPVPPQPVPQQLVYPPRPAAVVPPPPATQTLILPPDNPAVWFTVAAGHEEGPFTLADLHARLRSGQLTRETEVRREQGAVVPLGRLLGV